MTAEQEKRFVEMCARFGMDETNVSEMRTFVEEACEAAWERGNVAGASPFDGSWPSAE
jgi:hypothetical protein